MAAGRTPPEVLSLGSRRPAPTVSSRSWASVKRQLVDSDWAIQLKPNASSVVGGNTPRGGGPVDNEQPATTICSLGGRYVLRIEARPAAASSLSHWPDYWYERCRTAKNCSRRTGEYAASAACSYSDRPLDLSPQA